MKRIAAIIAGVVTAVAALAGTGKDNHVLTNLWKEYKAASLADLPLKQIEILAKIKKEATEKQLAWDFWDAAGLSVDVQASRNWKLRDSLEKAYEKEAMAFPVPVVGYAYLRQYKSTEKMQQYAAKYKEALSKNRNQAFYEDDNRTGTGLCGALPGYIKSDYEYAQWALALGQYGGTRDNAIKELRALLNGSYPSAPYLEYRITDRYYSNTSAWKEKMQEIADKYKGKAIALYPQAALLTHKLGQLQIDEKTKPEAFKALRAEAAGFEAARKAFSGSEATIVANLDDFKDIIKELDSKSLWLKVTPEKATVYLRNTRTAWLTMVNEEAPKTVLFRQELKNPKNSYYVFDTLEVKLPNLGDGEFLVVIGSNELKKDDEQHSKFSRYTYALSVRNSAAGYGIFATNAATGKPLEQVEVVLEEEKGKKHVKKVKLESGYTTLPDFGVKDIEDCDIYVRWKDAAGYERLSPDADLYFLGIGKPSGQTSGRLFLNTGAFHPGETIKFKGLIYKSLVDGSYAFEPAGKKASVRIKDPSGKEYLKEEYELSDMGTFAAEYTLPQEAKSGRWKLEMKLDGKFICYRDFYYGDFVLPTFECKFNPIEEAVLPGQDVHIKGRVESLTGHKLSEAKIVYEVHNYSTQTLNGTLKPNADGTFDIPFKTKEGYYYIAIKVTDATGETREFNTSLAVSSYVEVDGRLLNKDESYEASTGVVVDGKAKFEVEVTSSYKKITGAKYTYKLLGPDGTSVLEGEGVNGKELELDLSGRADGCYKLKLRGTAKNPGGSYPEDTVEFIKYTPGSAIPADVPELFWRGEEAVETGGDITFRIGSGTHPIWAAVELYGPSKEVLWTKTVFVAKGAFDKVTLPYQRWYYDDVCFGLVFFNDYRVSSYDAHYYRVKKDVSLPLTVTSFRDEARPGQEVTVELETRAGAEAVASVWDKASDAIFRNVWSTVYLRQNPASVAPSRNAVERPGANNYMAYGMTGNARYSKAAGVLYEDAVAVDSMAGNEVMAYAEEEAIPFQVVSKEEETPDVAAREDFSGALAFEPFLRAGADGKVSFTFKTSDKLSTFKMAVFAHDDKMRNNLIEKEFKVTLPVKVDVLKPEYLVAGDEFKLTATVSSAAEREVKGKLTVYCYDGADYKNLKPVAVTTRDVTVPLGGVVTELYEISPLATLGRNDKSGAPVISSEVEKSLSLLVSFKAEDGTSDDAMFFTVPVLERAQVLTEAHSAVLLAGADKDALLKDLQGRFTGTTHYGAEYKEITVLDMVHEALQQKLKESGNDVLSLTEALYVRTVLACLDVEIADQVGNDGKGSVGNDGAPVISSEVEKSLIQRIFELQNADGGFSWFKGFGSSPILTTVILERFHKMKEISPLATLGRNDKSGAPVISSEVEKSLSKAVKYLDNNHFSADTPYWRGGVSDAQYMYIRALYSDVAFTEPTEKEAAKKFKEFKKDAAEYLTPEKARGMNGQIMAKARRLNILRLLLASDAGVALAKQWGIKKSDKLEKSMKADVASLLQYAVRHKDGGWYYPNAVMPWRGLLETEAYAHCQLSNVIAGSDRQSQSAVEVADGIRLWLMLQKETQHWDLTPHFVDAIACILSGSKEVLDTKVLTLTKTYKKPLEEIVAAGNGFTISREFVRETTASDGSVSRQTIKPGQSVNKGDKITAIYHIYNAENRSFVRLRAPREATLRPVDQLSGYSWRYYKEVRTAYTDYFFDSMAEEKSTIREDFYVTQTGTFACGVPVIESLYAPHYRANSAFPGTLVAR